MLETKASPRHCLGMVMTNAQSVRALAAKIVAYGLVHFAVAAMVTHMLTGDVRLALAVGVIEPFVQTVFYGLYDRLWHRIDRRSRLSGVHETAEAFTARLDVMDASEQARSHGVAAASRPSRRRVALKTGLYTVAHFLLAIGVAWALTRDWRVAAMVGVAEPIVQALAFTLYDRLWSRRRRTPLAAA